MLIRRDVGTAPTLEVIAPDDIEDYEAVPLPGETAREREFRDALFRAILKAGTAPPRNGELSKKIGRRRGSWGWSGPAALCPSCESVDRG